MYRTIKCGELTAKDANKPVKVAGFVDTIRDHGGVIFVDLRDDSGIIQLVAKDGFDLSGITKESVISASGTVELRGEGAIIPISGRGRGFGILLHHPFSHTPHPAV
jgi:aspartyl-tRNA synthetase